MRDAQTRKGLISCIIPVHNRPQLIIECVESVLAQSYEKYEIIIVDDGSTDNTVEVLEMLSRQYPDTIHTCRQSNQGPGAARQTGLNSASGQFVQFLDSDDLIKPKKFELFMNEFNAVNPADIVFCITHYYLKEQPDNFIIWKQDHHQVAAILPGFFISRAWSTSTPIYRKRLLDSAGKILALRCEEDLEYDCRIGLQAPVIKFVNQHLTDFRNHAGQRFSENNPDRASQLSDQITARRHIYRTIRDFNLSPKSKEMKFFSKTMFLLARQAGEIGLTDQAKLALDLSLASSTGLGLNNKIRITAYQAICKFFGPVKGSWLFNAFYNRLHQIKNTLAG